MAVAVVIIATMSIFATILASLAFLPVVQQLGGEGGIAYNPKTWLNATSQAITARDIATTAILSLPIFLIGAIVIWALLAVSSRDYGEFGQQ